MFYTDLRGQSPSSTAPSWRFLILCATASLVLGCGQSEADDTLGVVGAIALPANRADFNHDWAEDLVVHGSQYGQTELWYLQTNSVGNLERETVKFFGQQLLVPDSSGWKGVGISDFDLDGNPDILWHNGITGETSLWFMDHTNQIGFKLLTNPDFTNEVSRPDSSGWQIAGTGDFNNDGIPDILWHNGVTGQTDVWHMTIIARPLRFRRLDAVAVQPSWNVPDSSGWRVAGINDFNHDGKEDIVWHHLPTGQISVWFMTDGTAIGSSVLSHTLPVDGRSEVLSVADQNHDGYPDILWNDTQGPVIYRWSMNGDHNVDDFILKDANSGQLIGLGPDSRVLNR
jgi:hypothetical protein